MGGGIWALGEDLPRVSCPSPAALELILAILSTLLFLENHPAPSRFSEDLRVTVVSAPAPGIGLSQTGSSQLQLLLSSPTLWTLVPLGPSNAIRTPPPPPTDPLQVNTKQPHR